MAPEQCRKPSLMPLVVIIVSDAKTNRRLDYYGYYDMFGVGDKKIEMKAGDELEFKVEMREWYSNMPKEFNFRAYSKHGVSVTDTEGNKKEHIPWNANDSAFVNIVQ